MSLIMNDIICINDISVVRMDTCAEISQKIYMRRLTCLSNTAQRDEE